MVHPALRTLVRIVVASLVLGTILAHFGVAAERLSSEFELSRSASPNGRGRSSNGRRRTWRWEQW